MVYQNEFDHKRLGRQMWYFVYPPSKTPDVAGFEAGVPEICLKKIRKLLPRCKQLKIQRDNWIRQIKNLNKPGSLEEVWLKTWAAAEYSEYYLIQRWLVYWTRLWRVMTGKPLPKKIGRTLKRIDKQDVERAKQVPIEPYFEGKLRRVGNRLMGLCPFHEEKSPSFCIYPDGKGYHCFGCQAHGDAIGFLMKTKGFSFPDAVRSLL
jgi:hypothetical protein